MAVILPSPSTSITSITFSTVPSASLSFTRISQQQEEGEACSFTTSMAMPGTASKMPRCALVGEGVYPG